MSDNVLQLFPPALADQAAKVSDTPPLPVMPYVVDIVIQLERIRATTQQALSVIRACPTLTSATAELINEICDGWIKADAANTALAAILECKGQA